MVETWVGRAAASTDAVLRIGAHVHAVAQSAALEAQVKLFSVQRAPDESASVANEGGNFQSGKQHDDRGGIAESLRSDCRRILRGNDLGGDVAGRIFERYTPDDSFGS